MARLVCIRSIQKIKAERANALSAFMGMVVIMDTILSNSLDNVPPPVSFVPLGIFLYPGTSFCAPSNKSVPQEVLEILGVFVR